MKQMDIQLKVLQNFY